MLEQVFAIPCSAPRLEVLLRRATGPGAQDPGSVTPRRVLVAVRGQGWTPAEVTAWWWPAVGRPVQWRCCLDLGTGQGQWYFYDPLLLVPLDRWV